MIETRTSRTFLINDCLINECPMKKTSAASAKAERRGVGVWPGLLLLWSNLVFANPGEVAGFWAGPSSIFEISIEDGTLTGTVRGLLNPVYLSSENTDKTGDPRQDDNNPNESLQDRPLIGLSMFSEYRYEDGIWQGKIYDPESGNTYQSRMSLNKKGKLEIRGYVGLPMFGRTATFVPASRCTETVRSILAANPGIDLCQNQE